MKLTITNSLATSEHFDYKIQKERTLHLVLRLHGENERQDARHQWQRDHQDPEHLPHSAHEPQQVNWCTRDPMCAQSSSQVPVVMICTPHRGSRFKLCARLTSSMHVVSVTLRLWALHSIQLPRLLILSQSPPVPPAPPYRRWDLLMSPTSPHFRDPGGMLSRSLGMPSRNNRPPDVWDTHGMSGKDFVNPTASPSAPYPKESIPWVSNVSEHTSPY